MTANAQPLAVMRYGGYSAESYVGSVDDGYAPQMQAPQMQMQAPPPQWGDVGQNHRGPFGDYMSDGQCSFVNEQPVGNC